MQIYGTFYKNHGVRQAGHFTAPPVDTFGSLELPKGSVVHYLSLDDVSIGPEPGGVLFKQYTARKLVNHITELHLPIGAPRPNRSTPVSSMVKDYHRRYRTMRPMHDYVKALRDEKTLMAFNYALLNHAYVYTRSAFMQYYKWHNVFTAMANNLMETIVGNERHHYIRMSLPQVIPAPSVLDRASGDVKKMSKDTLSVFSKPQTMLILELWKYLGPSKEQSIFHGIPEEALDRLDFIWVDNGKWFVMNLGKFLRINNEEIEKAGEDVEIGSRKTQKRFLRMMVAMTEYRSGSNPDVVVESDGGEEVVSPSVIEDKQSSGDIIDDDDVDQDLERLEKVQPSDDVIESTPILKSVIEKTPHEKTADKAIALAESGVITVSNLRRVEKLIEKSKTLDNPYGEGSFSSFRAIKSSDIEIDEAQSAIPPVTGVIDKSMLSSSLKSFDSKYISEIMVKDIANAAMSIENAGIIVTDYKVETVEDVANNYQMVSMKINPIDGESSTVRFRLPIINPDGEFTSNGVKYRLRKQRSDKPIRKTAPDTVALTSYYAKVFVTRSSRAVVNYPRWLLSQISDLGMHREDTTITDMKLSNTFISTITLPRIYTILATKFREFTINKTYRIYIDHARRVKEFGEEMVKQHEKDGYILCGINLKTKSPIVVDQYDTFYHSNKDGLDIIGSIESMAGFNVAKAPTEVAEFKLYSKQIPVGIALGYRYGLTTLMRMLGVTPRRVQAGSQINLAENEYQVKFSDETLVFSKDNKLAQLILAGLNRYHRSIAKYNVDSFDQKNVYVNVLDENGMRVGFVREFELALEMFVDPITLELLKEMGEPIALEGLLVKACELLLVDYHPDETDMSAMRIRGYERMAGAVFKEMVTGVRRYRSRGIGKAAKIEINPEAVWQSIGQDPSISQVEESNPIQNLKEQEIVTYMGSGGRSSRSMVKHTRAFHKSDMGVLSEATVDSGAVGVNAYLTANPRFTNLRGVTKDFDPKDASNSSMISTSALLAPAVEHDDPKRANFISIQHSHGVSSKGNRATPLRTGYERVLAHRVNDTFAHTAKQNGIVTAIVPDKSITITYKDGSVEQIEIGKKYGTVTGTIVPHEIVSDLSVGDKFKEGDIVTYNKGFFEPDPLSKNQVLWKAGVLVKTAIMEHAYTLEDASVISERVAKELETSLTSVRTIVVNFNQVIRNLATPGTSVDLETILCIIEDSVTADSNLFDKNSLDSLRLMSANSPLAKTSGMVDKIEVLYHGDLEDMSDSLRSIAVASDKERAKHAKALGKKVVTGSVDGSLRIDGNPLELDTMAIKIYITGDTPAGIGDKGVLANQMKTIFSHVMSGVNKTEGGDDLDVLFSYLSISNRIVMSPEIIGTTNTLLKIMSKRIADRYFGG